MSTFVVSAAIVDAKERKILLCKRSADTTYPHHWCTPGGSVERSETQLEALRRELREEINATFADFESVKNVVYFHDIRSMRSGRMITVVCYRIPIEGIEGTPSCGDKTADVRWFGVEELADLLMTPADRANVDALIRAMTIIDS